jgi:hypothetical protein
MKFFGIEIERKTDILALAAFILSITAALVQLSAFVLGPDVVLVPPEQVTILCVQHAGVEQAHFSTTFAYVNKGELGYNAAVAAERLKVNLKGRSLDYRWANLETLYVARGTQDADATLCERPAAAKLARANVQPAAPFAINAGSAVSHETTFAPRSSDKGDPNQNFVTWAKFIELLETGRELSFELIADVIEQKKVVFRCRVDVARALPGLKEKGWSAPSCWPIDD